MQDISTAFTRATKDVEPRSQALSFHFNADFSFSKTANRVKQNQPPLCSVIKQRVGKNKKDAEEGPRIKD